MKQLLNMSQFIAKNEAEYKEHVEVRKRRVEQSAKEYGWPPYYCDYDEYKEGETFYSWITWCERPEDDAQPQ